MNCDRGDDGAGAGRSDGATGSTSQHPDRDRTLMEVDSGLDPRLEPVALPALGFDQHDPCGLNKQNPQVAIATLGYLAEDGAAPG